MSLHGWVTAALAVGMLGLGALFVTAPVPNVVEPEKRGDTAERIAALETRLDSALRKLNARPRVARPPRDAAIAEAASDAAPDAPAALKADSGSEVRSVTADGISDRLAALESKVDLIAAQAGVDLTDPSELATEELTERASALSASNRNGAGGVAGYKREEALWRELLARALDDEARHKALYGLGITLRGQKRHAEEALVFEEMIERAGGIDTERGVSAGFQLAWARAYSDDNEASVGAFDSVANSAAVSPVLRVHALLRAGQYAVRTDEPDRAREYFRRLLEDHRRDVPASQPWLVTSAEQALKELDAN